MGARAVEPHGQIAVVAEHAESLGIPDAPQKGVQPSTAVADDFPMLIATTADMIDAEKASLSLAAARTLIAVRRQRC
mgnify:CR=1 FL=1